eukprot:COSAG02_NODE_2706_length_8192_cov_25.671197_1_plen_137_part_00
MLGRWTYQLDMLGVLRRCGPSARVVAGARQRSLAAVSCLAVPARCHGTQSRNLATRNIHTCHSKHIPVSRAEYEQREGASCAHAANMLERGSNWASWDPNPETAAEIRTLVERNDIAGLDAKLDGRLEFGTAGIRG